MRELSLDGISIGIILLFLSTSLMATETVLSHSKHYSLTAEKLTDYLQQNPDIDKKRLVNDKALTQEFIMDMHSKNDLVAEAKLLTLDKNQRVENEIRKSAEAILVKAIMSKEVGSKKIPDFKELGKERYLATMDKRRLPEKRKLAHILLTNKPFACRSSRCTLEITVDDLMDKINAGEDFEALAKKYSMDASTACDGGVINLLFTRDDKRIANAFTKALFKLEAVGDISDVFKTQYGIHVVKLLDIVKGRQLTYDELQITIQNELIRDYHNTIIENKRSQSYPDLKSINFEKIKEILKK